MTKDNIDPDEFKEIVDEASEFSESSPHDLNENGGD